MDESVKSVSKELGLIIKNIRLKSKVKVTPRFAPGPELEYAPYLFENSKMINKFMKRLPPSKGKKRCAFTTSSVGDFNLLATRTGVPTLVFGPGGGNIHAPNEYSNKKEVIESANYLLDFFMEVF